LTLNGRLEKPTLLGAVGTAADSCIAAKDSRSITSSAGQNEKPRRSGPGFPRSCKGLIASWSKPHSGPLLRFHRSQPTRHDGKLLTLGVKYKGLDRLKRAILLQQCRPTQRPARYGTATRGRGGSAAA